MLTRVGNPTMIVRQVVAASQLRLTNPVYQSHDLWERSDVIQTRRTVMTGKSRKFSVMFAVAAAMVMLMVFAGAASAGGDTPTKGPYICVDGYVINHREMPVNGTKTEPPLVVEAVDSTGAAVPMNVDANGYFKFKELAPGDYNFRLPLPTDWDGIVPKADRGGVAETGVTTFKEKDGCYRIVFKIRRLFDVTVIKWEELLDGTVRPGVDWQITFTPQGDPFVKAQTKNTDQSGGAVFTVTPGTWTVSEKVKNGWKPITPPSVKLVLDQYAPPGAMDPVVFKNLQPPCKSTIVVEKNGLGKDANGGQVWLGPLAGWSVTVARADNTMTPITKVTDATGKATFENLPPGVYKVSEVVQVGWKAISDNPQTVVHQDCETTRVLFENEEITGQLRIYGYKLFKAWEKPYAGHLVGLAGWKITAKLVGTDVMTETVTNGLGYYEFSQDTLKAAGMGFPGATIQVCEEDRDNWIHVTPKCVNVKFPYPVPADYTGVKVNFTNVQDPPLPGTGGAAPSGSCAASHTVRGGENLSGIAARYGSSVSAIAQANGISNPNLIRAGQTLCIP